MPQIVQKAMFRNKLVKLKTNGKFRVMSIEKVRKTVEALRKEEARLGSRKKKICMRFLTEMIQQIRLTVDLTTLNLRLKSLIMK